MITIYGDETQTPLKDAFVTVNYVYAHGKLEEMLGTDLLCAPNVVAFANGVWPVQVVDNDGKLWQAVVFFWNLGGLCVLSSDHEALKHAASKFAADTVSH